MFVDILYIEGINDYISTDTLEKSFYYCANPKAQFRLSGLTQPFRLDCWSNGGAILLYIGDYIPSGLLKTCKLPRNYECYFVEINISKNKLFLYSS